MATKVHGNATRFGFLNYEGLQAMFYVVPPSQSKFKDISNVPDYVAAASLHFISLMFLENIILYFKGSRKLRANDKITSIGAGMYSEMLRLVGLKSLALYLYIYIYENYRLISLPWDSTWTWIIMAISYDFLYYWFHRSAHEINLFWASHSTHHSSEDYNLSTALRQSSLQEYVSLLYFVPPALIMPPSVYIVHAQFNLLYQFWIHTEVIDNLGPLEYVLNTPSHHRVHHGRNQYCIDKNYGGTLIIWDRMFGTFQAEKKEEKVIYGLVVPVNSFEPTYVQFGYFIYVFKKCWAAKGLKNKLLNLFMGPGWSEGKPRLGNIEDIPEIENPVKVYGDNAATWLNIYSIIHFLITFIIYQQTATLHTELPIYVLTSALAFTIMTITSLGQLFDHKSHAPKVELLRCILCGIFFFYFEDSISFNLQLPLQLCSALKISFQLSVLFWILKIVVTNTDKEKIQ